MKTYLDCIPCFMDQALRAGRMVTDDEKEIKELLDCVGDRIKHIPLEQTPPETGAFIYQKVREITGVKDPYKNLKRESIKQVLKLYPRLKNMVDSAADPLLTAIRLATIGNVLDLGIRNRYDLDAELAGVEKMEYAVFDYPVFRDQLARANKILYIGDNAGETVFDRLLIETLGVPVTYAVREIPVINDATEEEAVQSGIHEVADIISSGTTAPGTILDFCSEEFMKVFSEADLVISKGQGNYEGLSGAGRHIFFILRAKCKVIARNLGVRENDFIFKYS